MRKYAHKSDQIARQSCTAGQRHLNRLSTSPQREINGTRRQVDGISTAIDALSSGSVSAPIGLGTPDGMLEMISDIVSRGMISAERTMGLDYSFLTLFATVANLFCSFCTENARLAWSYVSRTLRRSMEKNAPGPIRRAICPAARTPRPFTVSPYGTT